MMNIFGKSQKIVKERSNQRSLNDQGSGLSTLEERIETLEKRSIFLEKKCKGISLEAKQKLKVKNKPAAIAALKRKKIYDNELNKLHVAIENLEKQVFAIENTATTLDIVEGMKSAKTTQSKLLSKLDADSIGALQDDISDLIGQTSEVNNILSNSLNDDVIDDEELLAELDELDQSCGLEEKTKDFELTTNDAPIAFPKVPEAPVRQKDEKIDDDEAELLALAAEMAL